jgi:hypothetical protein
MVGWSAELTDRMPPILLVDEEMKPRALHDRILAAVPGAV